MAPTCLQFPPEDQSILTKQFLPDAPTFPALLDEIMQFSLYSFLPILYDLFSLLP